MLSTRHGSEAAQSPCGGGGGPGEPEGDAVEGPDSTLLPSRRGSPGTRLGGMRREPRDPAGAPRASGDRRAQCPGGMTWKRIRGRDTEVGEERPLSLVSMPAPRQHPHPPKNTLAQAESSISLPQGRARGTQHQRTRRF